MELDSAAEVLRHLIERSQAPIIIDRANPRILVPNGCSVVEVPNTMLNPVRKTAKRTFTDAESFCDYVNEQKLPQTRIYSPTATEFLAVFDHHQTEANTPDSVESKAGFGEHTAKLTLTHTPEWKTWSGKSTNRFSQRDFAVFIEDNQDDVTRPGSAELIDLIRTFRATSNAEFSSDVEDREGNSALSYVQQLKTKAGVKGDMEIPNDFDILVSPYEGGDKFTLKARLRFCVENGRLVLWYELVKLDRFLNNSVKQIAAAIHEATAIMPWFGAP